MSTYCKVVDGPNAGQEIPMELVDQCSGNVVLRDPRFEVSALRYGSGNPFEPIPCNTYFAVYDSTTQTVILKLSASGR